jgi:hypothetical protein
MMKSELLLAILAVFLSALTSLASGWKMHNIYWNTTNPMFRIDNTDNVIDINTNNLAWEYDQANIICPRYRKGTRRSEATADLIEQYVIYNVSKEEYEDCRITQAQPRVIAVCDQPHDLKYVTITFRSFTPTPGGLEFKPGKDYFFISTSSKSDLNRKLGGRCTTNNMRLVFKISYGKANTTLEASGGGDSQLRINSQVNVPRQYDNDFDSENNNNNMEDNQSKKLSDFHSYLYPMRDIIELDSNKVDQQSKRSENYANEVIKQEASVMHSNGGPKILLSPLSLASGLLLLLLSSALNILVGHR